MRIISPISAINNWTQKRGFKRVFVVGSAMEKKQIRAAFEEHNPELLVLLDFEKENIAYNTLQRLYRWLQEGVPAVSASPSEFYLKDDLRFLDTGAFAKLLESASGVRISMPGKPSVEYFQLACSLLKSDANNDVLGRFSQGAMAL